MATKSVVYGDFVPVFRQVREDDTSLYIPDWERPLIVTDCRARFRLYRFETTRG